MTRLISFTIVAILYFVSSAIAQQMPPTDSKAAQVTQTVLDKVKDAFAKHDAAAIAAIYTHDGTVLTETGERVFGQPAIEKYFAGVNKAFGSNFVFNYEPIEAHTLGKGVWTTVAASFTVDTPAGQKVFHSHAAYVFMPQGKDWKLRTLWSVSTYRLHPPNS